MKRRTFFAAFGAMCLSTLEAIASYLDPSGWHRHECPKCKYIWTHKSGSHNCPNIVNGKVCGGYQDIWYQGPLPPTSKKTVTLPKVMPKPQYEFVPKD